MARQPRVVFDVTSCDVATYGLRTYASTTN